MKTLNCVFVFLAFVGLSLVGCSNEQQSPVASTDQNTLEKLVRVNFTSVSYPTYHIYPGELTFPGGNMHLRNRIDSLRIESTNVFINSTKGVITYNVNGNAFGEGHAWGTITFIPDANPELEMNGTWNGQVTMTGASEWTLISQLVGHISGGTTNGMQVFWDIVVTYNEPTAYYWLGNATGYIKYNE